MEVIDIHKDVHWLPIPNQVSLVLDDQMPPTALITSAFALAFDGPYLLMTNLRQRGWDLPGGHIEKGESPEETLRREVLEESGCDICDIRLLGYQHIRLAANVPDGYRYPHPDSYQVLYLACVQALYDFSATAETTERGFFAPEAAKDLRWVRENRPLYMAALGVVVSESWQCRIT